MRKYLTRVLIGLDQFGNTLMGGEPDETISARAGRNQKRWPWSWLAWALNKIDRNHVEESMQSEREGRQQHPDYRRDA